MFHRIRFPVDGKQRTPCMNNVIGARGDQRIVWEGGGAGGSSGGKEEHDYTSSCGVSGIEETREQSERHGEKCDDEGRSMG